jgi:hypothetical protein
MAVEPAKLVYLYWRGLITDHNVLELRDLAITSKPLISQFMMVPYRNSIFNEDQGSLIVEGVVKRGDFEMAKWVYERYKSTLLFRKNSVRESTFVKFAVRNGQDEIFFHFWELDKSSELDLNRLLREAFGGGSLNIIRFLLEKGARDNLVECMSAASYAGHLEVIKFGCEMARNEKVLTTIFYDACVDNQIEVAKFLLSKGASPSMDQAFHDVVEMNFTPIGNEKRHELFLWLFDLTTDKKRALENLIDGEEHVIKDNDTKTATEIILNSDDYYDQLSDRHKRIVGKLLISKSIRHFFKKHEMKK